MSPQFSSSTPGMPSTTVAQMGRLVKALQDAQLENGELKQRLAELQDKIAALEASKPRRGKRGSHVSGTTNTEGNADEDKLGPIAKRYTIMHQLWVPDDVFPVSRPSKPSNDPSYFGTQDNWKLCIAAELYKVVPTAMHGMLKLASTGFRSLMGMQRQAMAHTLRNCTGRIFAAIDVPSQAFETKDSRHTSPELIALLKPSKNGLYPLLPPLLYPPGNTTDVFQNPVLPLILRVALFGKTSLFSMPAANSSGRKWAVTQVTTDGICLSAIMARFLASSDSELSPIGAQTKINYEQDFHSYYELIELTKNTQKGCQLHVFFQQVVFKEAPSSLDASGDDEDSEQDGASKFAHVKAAMLEADDDNDDEDPDNANCNDANDNDNDNANDNDDIHTHSQRRINAANRHEPTDSFDPPSSPSPTPSPPLSYITAVSLLPQDPHLRNGPSTRYRVDTALPLEDGQWLAFEQATASTSCIQPTTISQAVQPEPTALEVDPSKGKGRGRGVKRPRGKAVAAISVRDEQLRCTSQRKVSATVRT
ncbi:hypothetical protein BDN71DRAFT_1505962 [Pleurotus eryngii]|uniref:Uncharacterized protein n=1 Tax=Pleurotus eryngii TaxID=5323 RepID=A0A9P6DG63_PLEER|nr:hypothetical protein BDN71DRAFT_1505962 [Pleurotus eryngii]